MDYQLEIKQIVDYPRCRIYRDFLQTLMKDKSIRTSGCSYLFYYMLLCSYANFRSSYRRLDGISYLVGPGEWICRVSEMTEWFRTRFQHQAISILDHLQDQHYISYTRLGHGNLIKFSINGWKNNNTSFDYHYPCQKDVGFFFFPISSVHELISTGKCSEMDIVLDLWVHAIYNDDQIQGSELGPVVYFRNFTGNPVTNYSDLALRWGISKATVSRLLHKLQEKEYLSLVCFTGKHGSIIYLRSYLSTMFQISDVMVDKEEISLSFQIPVTGQDTAVASEPELVGDLQLFVPKDSGSVSESYIKYLIKKTAGILAAQGILCCECPRTQYKLYSLSDCSKTESKYCLQINCPDKDVDYQFELLIRQVDRPNTFIQYNNQYGSNGKKVN